MYGCHAITKVNIQHIEPHKLSSVTGAMQGFRPADQLVTARNTRKENYAVVAKAQILLLIGLSRYNLKRALNTTAGQVLPSAI